MRRHRRAPSFRRNIPREYGAAHRNHLYVQAVFITWALRIHSTFTNLAHLFVLKAYSNSLYIYICRTIFPRHHLRCGLAAEQPHNCSGPVWEVDGVSMTQQVSHFNRNADIATVSLFLLVMPVILQKISMLCFISRRTRFQLNTIDYTLISGLVWHKSHITSL